MYLHKCDIGIFNIIIDELWAIDLPYCGLLAYDILVVY